jgi:hypothetical protein
VNLAFHPRIPSHFGTRPLPAPRNPPRPRHLRTRALSRSSRRTLGARIHRDPINEPSVSVFTNIIRESVDASLTPLTRVNRKSFSCHSYKKHPGWGIPPSSANSTRVACPDRVGTLRPTRYAKPTDPSHARAKAHPGTLTPLSATLTKNRGEPASRASRRRVILLRMTASCEPSPVSRVAVSVTPLSATLTKKQGKGARAKHTVRRTRATDHESKMIRWHRLPNVGAQHAAPQLGTQPNPWPPASPS